MVIRERYDPVVIGANSTYDIKRSSIGCFLCTTTGTITLSTKAVEGEAAVTLLSAMPVTAGVYYPLPFFLGVNGGIFTTGGGAIGVLGV
jgi:hypothetical protein